MSESPRTVETAIYDLVLPPGEGWIYRIPKGYVLRIVDLEGNQAVDTLFFDAANPQDGYSAWDTVREQGNVYLVEGSRLLSKTGAHLLTIIHDTCGRHDTIGGACSAESNSVRYPLERRYMHNCRDTFLKMILESGFNLRKEDLPPNINFFMNVPVSPDGKSTFADGISAPGKYVELRAERDVICLISNCPQLNNPCNAYNPTPIRLLLWSN